MKIIRYTSFACTILLLYVPYDSYGMLYTLRSRLAGLTRRLSPSYYYQLPYAVTPQVRPVTLSTTMQSPVVHTIQTPSSHITPHSINYNPFSIYLLNASRWFMHQPTSYAMFAELKKCIAIGIGFEDLIQKVRSGRLDDIINVTRYEQFIAGIPDAYVTILDDCIIELLKLNVFGLHTIAASGAALSAHIPYTYFFDVDKTPQLISLIQALISHGAETFFIPTRRIFLEMAACYSLFDKKILWPYKPEIMQGVTEYKKFLKELAEHFFSSTLFHIPNVDSTSFEPTFAFYVTKYQREYDEKKDHTKYEE